MQVEVLAILSSGIATATTAAGLFYFEVHPLVAAVAFVGVLAAGAVIALMRDGREPIDPRPDTTRSSPRWRLSA